MAPKDREVVHCGRAHGAEGSDHERMTPDDATEKRTATTEAALRKASTQIGRLTVAADSSEHGRAADAGGTGELRDLRLSGCAGVEACVRGQDTNGAALLRHQRKAGAASGVPR